MRHIYAFESKDDYIKYQEIIERFSEKLKKYQKLMEEEFELIDPPKGIVWTTEELATSVLADQFAPAYTNENVIHFSPDLESWKALFIKQLEGRKNARIERFYKNLSENQLFTLVAHELTHHLDLFLDDFDDEREDSIWFEEGMCDYLARKMTLNKVEFKEITEVESELVKMFNEDYGNHSLDVFGSGSYQGSLTSIMFDYWRSFLSIKYLVEVRANHDIKQVFKDYHKWDKEGRVVPLTAYFELNTWFLSSR
ncbi:hypothetical protein CFK37_18300 [Virgibacillus phasianinus]|uniref:Uncharacterized protein n=1 Tax=Virgibacillus phasianinus TaxID=2017483 RepID=A0A220U753_9BACI|nr:hypothetical protein [Virgibacillus phasianinus]ASK63969.1 hypothetical protein CFK37_18300 [Virgibacillus phasianinus]